MIPPEQVCIVEARCLSVRDMCGSFGVKHETASELAEAARQVVQSMAEGPEDRPGLRGFGVFGDPGGLETRDFGGWVSVPWRS